MNTTSEFPDTPSELIKNNTTTTPEELWERFRDLSVKDKELFIYNTCDWMKNFHKYMVDSMMEEDEMSKEDVGIWIQDGTKWGRDHENNEFHELITLRGVHTPLPVYHTRGR